MTNILDMTVIPSSSALSAERTEGPSPARLDFGTLLQRIAWPFFLFSAVLAFLLTLSWAMLLPRYARVEVGGIVRTAEELPGYKAQLLEQMKDGQAQRRAQLMAVRDPLYIALRTERQERRSVQDVERLIRDHAKTAGKDEGVVHLIALEHAPSIRTVTVRGDVRNAGPGSMTVLAEYIESLKAQPFAQSVSTPAFTREDDPVLGLHSPFIITLTLADA